MSYDPGYYDDPQGLLDQELLNYLYSANQYGIGPGQLSSSKDMYKGLGYQEDAISDIFKTAGIYPEDLLGIQEPEAPGEMPTFPTDVFQSDIAAAYSGNPLAQIAFEAMNTQGVDPVAAANAAVAAYREDPESFEQWVPQNKFNNQTVNPEQSVMDFINPLTTQYAEDMARQRREGGAATAEYNQAMEDYMRKKEEHFRYNNDVSGLYDRGNPTLEKFRAQLGLDRGDFGGVRDVDTRRSYEGTPNAGAVSRIGAPLSYGARSSQGGPLGMVSKLRQGVDDIKAETNQRKYGRTMERGRATGATRKVQEKRDRWSRQDYEKLKNTVVPSGREIDNRRRMALQQVLMGMI